MFGFVLCLGLTFSQIYVHTLRIWFYLSAKCLKMKSMEIVKSSLESD